MHAYMLARNMLCGKFAVSFSGICCNLMSTSHFSSPNQTRLITYNQTDLGGLLPKAIVETALPSNMMNFFSCVKKAMKEDGVMKED